MRRLFIIAALAAGLQAQTVTINWSTHLQTIDGFGAAVVDTTRASGLDPNIADLFFRQDTGLGFSIARIQIVPTYDECNAWFNTQNGYGYNDGCVFTSGATILKGELAAAKQAQDRGVATFFASQWSPSGIYKSNNSYSSGGSLIGNSTNYTAIATELNSFVTLMTSNNIPVTALSLQNEPDISQSYPSCTWTAQQIHDFVPYLYADLPSSTPIMIPEQGSWAFNLAATAFNDPTVAGEVGFIAGHAYFGSPGPTGLNNVTTQHIWMTEVSSQSGTYDGSISDALTDATEMHNYLTQAKINAWIWWFISDQLCCGNGTDNSALTDFNGNIPLRAYATGNWSKFVRPGWQMVGVTNSGPLLVTAFASPGEFLTAIVVINTSGSPANNQQFSVGTAMGSQVTPWVTSASFSLQSQNPVNVSSGSFSYTIPASSVVTFAGIPPVTAADR